MTPKPSSKSETPHINQLFDSLAIQSWYVLTFVVVSEVVPFLLCEILWQPRMMQRIVHRVVENVKCECTGNDAIGDCGGEDDVCEVCEWGFESKEQGGRHDQPESVHW